MTFACEYPVGNKIAMVSDPDRCRAPAAYVLGSRRGAPRLCTEHAMRAYTEHEDACKPLPPTAFLHEIDEEGG